MISFKIRDLGKCRGKGRGNSRKIIKTILRGKERGTSRKIIKRILSGKERGIFKKVIERILREKLKKKKKNTLSIKNIQEIVKTNNSLLYKKEDLKNSMTNQYKLHKKLGSKWKKKLEKKSRKLQHKIINQMDFSSWCRFNNLKVVLRAPEVSKVPIVK